MRLTVTVDDLMTVDIRDREPCSPDRLDDWCNRVANLLITVQVARADATQANT